MFEYRFPHPDFKPAPAETGLLKHVSRRPRAASGKTSGRLPPNDPATCDDEESLPLWQMKITQPALRELLDFLLSREPEAAGLLLGPANDDLLVTDFVPDLTGRGTPASFELGTPALNDLLKQRKPAGINCKGIAHNHPIGVTTPSYGDLAYLRRVFGLSANADTGQFYLPIVCGGRLYPYVYAQGRVWCAELVLI